MTQSERLRRYNRWRRGDKRLKQPDPTALGVLIDGAADRLEVLEREHRDFFEQWHAERRKREKLLSDIRISRAHNYLGMCRRVFDATVRPHVRVVPIGKQGKAVDRHELDALIAANCGDLRIEPLRRTA
jgi:hypothetical protein